MLVMLSAVDLVDAIVLLPEPEQHTTSQGHGSVTLCEVQGVLAIFSETSSFFWTAAVAVFLFHDSRDSEHRWQCCGDLQETSHWFAAAVSVVAFGYPLAV